MRIAVDVVSIREDGSAGGATGFAIELIRGLSNVPGNTVFVLCADWNANTLKKSLPTCVRFLQIIGRKETTGIVLIDKTLSKLEQKINSRGVLHANRIDVLCCPFSAIGNRENGIPVVSTILDIQHEFYPQFFEAKELYSRKRFYTNIVRKADWITCISDYTKDTFCDLYKFPRERATTIYIAVEDRFKNSDDRILQKLNLVGEQYILFPANFWEHKNHRLLLLAFSMYVSNGGKGKLVLSGNPLGQEEYYNNVIKGLGIKGHVEITGYLSNEEVFSLLKNMKGLIFPSLFEGFGIPIVEAMLLHKLVASSNLTSLPEIGCDNIFYFNPQKPDEILAGIKYLFETEMTADIINDYNNKLQEYQTQLMVEKYMDVFKHVIKNQRKIVDEHCEGIYPDKWSEKQIDIQFNGHMGEIVSFSLSNPEFVNMDIKIKISHNGRIGNEILRIGEQKVIELKIIDEATHIKMKFSPTWNPHHLLSNDDNRNLGVLVNGITVDNAEESISLQTILEKNNGEGQI